MLLDKVTQVAENNEYLYHEPMVHPALASHPDPQSVCVIGAGDGGIVREVLKHNPSYVVHAELDSGVVEASRKYFPSIHDGCWEDPRVDLQITDGRAYIEKTDKVFDVVCMDMTDPCGPATMLYTQEFFQSVKARLRDDNGMFVMHAESTITNPRTFQQITRTLETVWPEVHFCHLYVQMYSTLWSIAIASDRDNVRSTSLEVLEERLRQRGMDVNALKVYSPSTHHSMQVGFPFIDDLIRTSKSFPVVTDASATFLDESAMEMDASDLNLRLNADENVLFPLQDLPEPESVLER
jgi:spermidine synthase